MNKKITVFIIFIMLGTLFLNRISAQAVPLLSVPANTSTWESTTPTLYWWYVPYIYSNGPFNYQVQVSLHPSDFSNSNLVVNQIVSGSNSAFYTIPAGLLGVGVTYYWKVGISNYYSPVWSFTPSVGPSGGGIITLQAPNLVAPIDASIDISVPVSFSWSSVPNAVSYRIQASTNNSFSILVKDTIVSSTGINLTGFHSLSTYYWRVRAQNFTGISQWSGTFSFTTILTPPSIVTLLSPLNNSISYVTNPTLIWSSVPTAASYELQISTNNLFSVIVYGSSGITDSQKQVSGLLNNMQYYWRVRAINSAGTGSWSSHSRFTVNVPLPATPVLILPADNNLNVPINFVFTWNHVDYSDSYTLQISTDDFFSNIVVNQTLTDTSYSVSNLNYSSNFFWRVAANNVVGTGNWSQLRFFRTRKAPPAAPVLISPTTGSFPTNFEFQWANGFNSSEVNRYKLQVSLTGSFVTGMKTYNNLNQTSKLVEGLYSQSLYYWRVKAYTPTDSSQWSAVSTFNTIANSNNIYVNGSTGDDFLNNGTLLLPFKTILKAFTSVNLFSFDTVHVADGYYPEELTLVGGFALVGSAHTSVRSITFVSNNYKYVKNIEIVYDGLGVYTGFLLANTSNAYLENITSTSVTLGLQLINIINGHNIKIVNCVIENNLKAIRIDYSSYIELNNIQLGGIGSVVVDGYGLIIKDSDNIDVNNLSTQDQQIGVLLRNVSDIDFKNTSIKNCGITGLFIGPSNNLTFDESVIDNCSRGVWIEPNYSMFNSFNILGGNTSGIKNNNSSVQSVSSFTTADNITFSGSSEIKNNGQNGLYAYGPGGIAGVNSLKLDGDIHFTNNASVPDIYNGHITLRGNINDPLIKGCRFSNNNSTAITLYSDFYSNTLSGVKINNNVFNTLSSGFAIQLSNYTENNVDGRNNSFPFLYASNLINSKIVDSLDNPNLGYVDLSGLDFGSELGPTISIQSVPNAYKGASYYLDVEITTDGNSYNFLKGHFTYDTTNVKYLNYVSDGLINQNAWSSLNISDSTISGSTHAVKFSAFGLTPITQNGKLFRLYFKVQPGAINGTVLINGTPVNFYGNNVPNVFEIRPSEITIGNPPGPVQSKGDVTLDAVVTLDDFMALLYHLNGSQLLTDPQALVNADYNNDSAINQLDLNALYSFLNPGMPIINPNIISGRLEIANISYKNENSANIPITINDASEINNMVVRLNYDPAQVDFHSFKKNTELGGTYVYGYENKPGEAVFVLQSKQLLSGTVVPGDIKVGFVENHLPIGSVVTTKYSINGNEFVNGPNFRFDYNGITGIEDEVGEELPAQFDLSQNYPNPFNPSTKINYSLSQPAYVRLVVFDILGREVKTLINAEQNSGRYTVNWNSNDNFGSRVASGIYIYRIIAGNFISTKKMMLLK